MNDPTITRTSSVRSDVIGSAFLSFATGSMLTTAMYYVVRGDPFAWLFVGCAAVMATSVFVVVRRALRKLA